MGKAGRWLRSFLAGKKESKKDRPQSEAMPVTALPGAIPKDRWWWGFRRPVLAEKAAEPPGHGVLGEAGLGLLASEAEFDQKKHAAAVAVAAAADAAVAAVIRLSSRKAHLPASLVEEAAAVRIQATFRGYLARTGLRALRGIVKLQALVRGQLVRKQANATLRCMQALLKAQSQLRAQRMLLQERRPHHHQPPPRPRPSPQHPRHRRSYEMDRSCEENAKIVEMDSGEPARRGAAKVDRQFFVEYHGRCSPAPSSMTELSPRAYSGHFEDLSFATAHGSPQYVAAASEPASELFLGYMANTESSRAKARSRSAPRQRIDALERQPSRRKGAEPRSAKMQRSSSQAGAVPRGGQFLWSSVKLGTSSASLKDSECGSTSSVLTAATVYSRTRSLVGFEARRGLF